MTTRRGAIGRFQTFAAALVTLLGLAAGPARGEAPKPPATPPTEQPAATPPAGGGEMKAYKGPFVLPGSCRKADGTYDQEAIVLEQQKRLETINAKLGTSLIMIETPHFLIFSDADKPTTRNFIQWCEPLYAALSSQFGVGPKDRAWDGKCILLLFKRNEDFAAYARDFDEYSTPENCGGYFSSEGYLPTGPRLTHIVIPIDKTGSPLRQQEVFVHEGTHAFFHAYCGDIDLPYWLDEGLAEYMTALNNPAMRGKKRWPAVNVARSGRSVKHVIGGQAGAKLVYEDYAVAYTLVDCLISADRVRFRKFVDLLKEKKSQEEALNAAYGFGTEELEKRWRQALTGKAPRGPVGNG